MNNLENAYYLFSITAISLQILLLLLVIGVVLFTMWKIRQTQKRLRQIAPFFLVSKLVGTFIGNLTSAKKNRR